MQARARYQKAMATVRVAQAALKAERSKVDAAGSDLKRYESELTYRQKQFDRLQELFKRKSIADEIVNEAQSRLDTAASALDAAKARLLGARAASDEAEARLEAAKADVVEVEADLKAAEAGLDKAQILLSHASVVSPMDGVVTRRNFHAGDFVRSGAEAGSVPLVTVVRTDKMRVVVGVPDRDAPLLDKGDLVTVRIDALGGRVYRGTVARTAVAEDPISRTLRAEIDLGNPDGRLRPGQHGTVSIVLEDRDDRLTIPASAIVNGWQPGGEATCYRVVNGRAVRTTIRVGGLIPPRVEVFEGLKEGDTVVVNPGSGISDGQPIETEPKPPAAKD
jgi:RND family efflux transporter MFP subunit